MNTDNILIFLQNKITTTTLLARASDVVTFKMRDMFYTLGFDQVSDSARQKLIPRSN